MRIMRPRRSCADALAKPWALLALQGTSAVHLVARHRVRERHLLASIWACAAAPLGRSDLQLLHLIVELVPRALHWREREGARAADHRPELHGRLADGHAPCPLRFALPLRRADCVRRQSQADL